MAVLESMCLALTADASRLWRQGVPDRCFVNLFLRLSCKMLELPETTKSARQADLALRLISEPFHLAQGMETEFSSAVFFLVRENKHLADFVARLCGHLVEEHGDARLGAELVREIVRMDMPEISRCVRACVHSCDRPRALLLLLFFFLGVRSVLRDAFFVSVSAGGCSATARLPGSYICMLLFCCSGKLRVVLWARVVGLETPQKFLRSFSRRPVRHHAYLFWCGRAPFYFFSRMNR